MLQLHVALFFIAREGAQGLGQVLPDLLHSFLLGPSGARLQIAGQTVDQLRGRHG